MSNSIEGVYEYKGRQYTASGELIEMKCPVTRKWLKAVAYFDEVGKTYIREFEDFRKKFTLIVDDFDLDEDSYMWTEDENGVIPGDVEMTVGWGE